MPAGLDSTTSIANWNRATKHVEAAIRSGRYINAETALIFAGPPRVSDIGGLNNRTTFAAGGGVSSDGVYGQTGQDALYPIGLVEQFGVQQVHSPQKMFEIGSRRSYQAPGRVQVTGAMGRVMFNGPSLLRALYAYYPNTIQLANGKRIGPNSHDSISSRIVGASDAATQSFPPIYFEAGSKAGRDPESPNQYDHSFFINLMSELFSHPFGIGIQMRDNRNRNYGAFYIEDCMILSHSINLSAGSNLITEAISFQADACVPMEFSTDAGAQIAPLSAA